MQVQIDENDFLSSADKRSFNRLSILPKKNIHEKYLKKFGRMNFLHSTLHKQIGNKQMLRNTYHIKNTSWFCLQGEAKLTGCFVDH